MVARPAEQVLGQIAGIEHTYSVSRPGMAVLTVQFKVGVPRTEALVRLYDVLNANQDWLPRNLGALPPIVKPKGIDDVPVLGRHAVEPRRDQRAANWSAWPARWRPSSSACRGPRGADHRRPGPRGAGGLDPGRCASAVSTCCACSRRWPRPTWACLPAAWSTPRATRMLAVETGDLPAQRRRGGRPGGGRQPGRRSTCARWPRSGRRAQPQRYVWFTPGRLRPAAGAGGGGRLPGGDADGDQEARQNAVDVARARASGSTSCATP
jgi:hypothetical protein